jgi:outer membrane protein assembly factor BamB
MNNNVVAIDDHLNVLWTFTPGEAGAFYSSPCVVNDSFAYVGNDNGKVYAINTLNGTQKWSFVTGAQVRSSPIQIGGNVLVGSDDRNFYSVDSATGLLRWKVQTGDAIQSSPVVFNQNVYFGSYDSKFYCIDIIDGEVKWSVPTQALIKSSPVYFNGDIYFGGYDKLLYRLDATTGAQRVTPFRVNGQMATSPVIDAVSTVYVPSISGDYRY